MAERMTFGTLLARSVLVVGPIGLVAIGTQVPLRSAEAQAYAAAPACAPGVTDSSACRLMADAEVFRVDSYRYGMESRQIELRVGGQRRFIRLLNATAEGLKVGDRLRVELFRGRPTAAELGGALERAFGSPDMAVRTMAATGLGTVVAMLVSAAYLHGRRARA